MSDGFDRVERTLAFAPDLVDRLAELVAAYGAAAFDQAFGGEFPCLYARWDDAAHTRLRAASVGTERLVALDDGRLAVTGALFARALLEAVARGDLKAEELKEIKVLAGTLPEVSCR